MFIKRPVGFFKNKLLTFFLTRRKQESHEPEDTNENRSQMHRLFTGSAYVVITMYKAVLLSFLHRTYTFRSFSSTGL